MHRRIFLRRGFIGVMAAALGFSPARAQWRKMTKKEAGYIARDKPASQMCAQCLYFIDPNDCVMVEGPISPLGWCKYYGD
jgi:hypothetical protein